MKKLVLFCSLFCTLLLSLLVGCVATTHPTQNSISAEAVTADGLTKNTLRSDGTVAAATFTTEPTMATIKGGMGGTAETIGYANQAVLIAFNPGDWDSELGGWIQPPTIELSVAGPKSTSISSFDFKLPDGTSAVMTGFSTFAPLAELAVLFEEAEITVREIAPSAFEAWFAAEKARIEAITGLGGDIVEAALTALVGQVRPSLIGATNGIPNLPTVEPAGTEPGPGATEPEPAGDGQAGG